MKNKRLFIPEHSTTFAELLLVTLSVKSDLGLNPETTNRTFVGHELMKRFGGGK